MGSDYKAKFWVGILWVDSMVEDWRERLDILIQMPYTFCLHDKDKTFHGDPKAPHVHIMVAWKNTTTENSVTSMFNELSKPGMQCCNKVFRVRGVKYMDDYLIHDTQVAKKQGKHLYSPSERIRGLGWNTDVFNELQQTDKLQCVMEISDEIKTCNIQTYVDLYDHIIKTFDLSYFEILISYSSHFDRMVKGQWQKNRGEKRENQ